MDEMTWIIMRDDWEYQKKTLINTVKGQPLGERIGINMSKRTGINMNEMIGINMSERIKITWREQRLT